MRVVDEVRESLSLFNNLYDVLRIIEPVSKRVIYIEGDQETIKEQFCYCYWGKNVPCNNCITMRAQIENDTYIKLESKKDKIYLMISTPISINDDQYIVELLKDISDKGFLNNENILELNNTEELITEMNEKIVRDELTGLYNRRYINERLPMDINKSIAEGRPFSIIMVDIDLFKEINDTYGHSVGDKVLIDFAKILEGSVRANLDWVGRFGGEEFLIALMDTDSKESYHRAEVIRKLLENTIFDYDNIKIKITPSFGVCSTANGNDIETLLVNADKNLYKAKESGRNKTVIDI